MVFCIFEVADVVSGSGEAALELSAMAYGAVGCQWTRFGAYLEFAALLRIERITPGGGG